MSTQQFACPRCFKRCGNAGALKTHMKTHKKPEPKSGSMMKWIIKREPVKAENKQKPKESIELKPIRKTRQLKLRKPSIRDPTVVTNPARPRPPRAPRRSKQPAIDTSPFAAPARLADPGLDKRSPQFRIAHVQHFNTLKSEVVIPRKQKSKRKREANESASSKRAKPNPKPQAHIPKKLMPRPKPNKQGTKKRPRVSLDVLVPGPPPGQPPKRFKPSTSKPSSIPSRR